MKKTKPKSNRSAKKGGDVSPKKAAKKELEIGIAERFLDVVSNLGHDAERIAKDIKKMSKEIAKKLSEKIKGSKKAEKLSAAKKTKADIVTAKREVKASKQDVVKASGRAEKTKATAAARPAVKPVVKHTPQLTSSSAHEAPKRRSRRSVQESPAAKSKVEAKTPVQKRTRRPVAPKPVNTEASVAAEAPDKINAVENHLSSETVETKSE